MQTFSGRRASQDCAELQGFIELLKSEGVTSYGEIGARHGDTFHQVLMAVRCRGVAMDLPGGLWGTSKSRASLERAVSDLVGRGFDASCLFGDSKTLATQQMFCNRGPYDAILIDGDHTYEGVLADWTAYRGMARLIAFHDIVGTDQFEKPTGRRVEVPRLWSEIRDACRTTEFVSPGSQMGIGVVWVS